MTELTTAVTWVDVREGLPPIGVPVAAAITGRYPARHTGDCDGCDESGDAGDCVDHGEPADPDALGEEFWLVRPMYFTNQHWDEDETEYRDCFVDSDEVVRLPHGRASEETVTHWAELPTLPGGTTHGVFGEDVQPAFRNAWDMGPGS